MAVEIIITSAFEELVEYLAKIATPEQILAFKVSDAIQERGEELLDKNNDNEISPEERVELEQLRQFHQVVSKLKAHAMLTLRSS